MRRFGLHLIAAFGAALSSAAPAFAIDCAKAQEPVETAICSDTAAKAADDAMGAAFKALLGKLSGPERDAALDSQRIWIGWRGKQCQSHDLPPAACAKEKAIERTAVLTGRPETGTGLAGRLQPRFLRRGSVEEGLDFGAQLFRFSDPQGSGEQALNQEADESARMFQENTTDFIEEKKRSPDTGPFRYHENWMIRYASPVFVSIWKEQDDYSGGAHPNSSASGLNVDLKKGRVLKFDDLFEKKSIEPIARLCLEDIEKNEKERLPDIERSELEARAAITVGNLVHWSFTETDARIFFDVGALADSYAEGAFRCTMPLDRLGKLAEVPLPPR